ncbi:MAG: peptidase M22, partial [Eubacteriales bacterium]
LSLVDEGGYIHVRRILDVKKGECGLRQSDALFLHTVHLPELFPELFEEYKASRGISAKIDAVAYSARPRDVEGSYMPCFLAGKSAACAVSSSLNVPVMDFSHQAGHIMAAQMTCGSKDIKDEFLALHLSGGTTELVHAKKDRERGFLCDIVCESADISAGQLIDRAGVMMGLKFPCGGELEALALKAGGMGDIPSLRVCVRDGKCNLSGAENRISELIKKGADIGETAYFTLDFVARNVISLVNESREKFPSLPVIFAGGVMRNSIIREKIKEKIENIYFASEELSSDNAVGTGYLGYYKFFEGRDLLRREER